MLIHENFMMNENWGVKVRKLNLWTLWAHEYRLYMEGINMYIENYDKLCIMKSTHIKPMPIIILLFLILLFHMMELNCLDLREKRKKFFYWKTFHIFYSIPTHSPS